MWVDDLDLYCRYEIDIIVAWTKKMVLARDMFRTA